MLSSLEYIASVKGLIQEHEPKATQRISYYYADYNIMVQHYYFCVTSQKEHLKGYPLRAAFAALKTPN